MSKKQTKQEKQDKRIAKAQEFIYLEKRVLSNKINAMSDSQYLAYAAKLKS